MINPIKFGTDGWRAVIAEDFTFDNVRICAQGLADYLKQSGLADRDWSSAMIPVLPLRTLPLPLPRWPPPTGSKSISAPKPSPLRRSASVSLTKKAGAAIVITASHNPARYNGFKIKSADGASAPTEMIAAVEKNIHRIFESGEIKRMPLAEALKQGLVEQFNFDPLYLEQMAKFVDLERMKKSGLKIVVDSMYGAGCGYFKNLLSGGSAQGYRN